MKYLFLSCLLVLGLLSAACSGPQKLDVEMKIQQQDASNSTGCLQKCTRERNSCRNMSKKRSERTEVSGPREVSKEDWGKAYREAQQNLKTCDQKFNACREDCPD